MDIKVNVFIKRKTNRTRKYSYAERTHVPCFDDDKRETFAEISTLQFLSMPCKGAAEKANKQKQNEVSSTA